MEDPKFCELCGKRAKRVMDVVIEGSLISVCPACANYGKTVILERPNSESQRRIKKIPLVEENYLITKNYPQLIKQARESQGLLQKELAEKIGEKESVIHQLESGSLEPSAILAKKLENFLKINLIEKYEETNKKISLSDTSLTIGDLLNLKKK